MRRVWPAYPNGEPGPHPGASPRLLHYLAALDGSKEDPELLLSLEQVWEKIGHPLTPWACESAEIDCGVPLRKVVLG